MSASVQGTSRLPTSDADEVLTVSPKMMRRIALIVSREFDGYVKRYSEKKYPPKVLAALRTAFSTGRVSEHQIRQALLWKYGKDQKSTGIPANLNRAIDAIVRSWPKYQEVGAPTERSGFDWWQAALPRTSYISYCFILHLRSPASVPIIDQHNFRAVHFYLDTVGQAVEVRLKAAAPRSWEHVMLVREFIDRVARVWPFDNCPSLESIDRFLMMRGKALKASNKGKAP